jgi:hypothetical protein
MIQDLINQAKAQGLQTYGPENLTTYFYFTDGERIGYCQIDRLTGPSWSTVHKPNQTTGTGFGAESFNEALQFAPAWASSRDSESVKKFKSWDEFSRQHWQPLTQY